jgi:hypothetical protein
LLIGISAKNAWMPCLLSLIVWGQRRKAWVRWTMYGLFALAPVAVLIVYRWFLRAADGSDISFWGVVRAREGGEGDPFWISTAGEWLRVAQFVLLCLLSLAVRLPNPEAQGQVRRMMAVFMAIWLAAAAYVRWAPTFLQVPQLVVMAPNRGSWLPQLIAYAAVASWVISARQRLGTAWCVAAVVAMMAMPFPPSIKFGAMLVSIVLMVTVLWVLARPWLIARSAAATNGFASWLRTGTNDRSAECILLPSLVAFVIALFAYGIACNRSDLRTLLATGVMGCNGSSLWTGVAEYLHDNTPADSVILSFSWYRDGHSREDYRVLPVELRSQPDDLVANGTLRSRSGRANVAPIVLANVSLRHHLLCHERWRILNDMGRAWKNHDAKEVMRLLPQIGRTPDYIVAPASEVAWVKKTSLGYEPVTTIGQFGILRLTKQTQPP